MCCGNGCTPHRPLVNADRDGVGAGPVPAATPVEIPQEPRPVGVESRRNGRWWFRSNRQLTDVQESYDGRQTALPRASNTQVDQMAGVIPTPATGLRRTARRDTGAGGGCT